MLDTETRRRIDTARDVLVGKVPDPKSQVEQITIALIYKFMDDMDAEAEELGGKRKFFAKEFQRYGWAKLMRSGLGGNEILKLYTEAIDKMPENPGIPPLFRDIFKNAYLPYRDPETLKMFLKVIDEFTYDHSERLGDAFEYLLSIMSSQGEAGQFRTPRHIIDFIVEIVDPKKNETVLDPACGTAGFLISSYKHILKANTDAKGNVKLTPDEKQKLAQNFTGYDISPDMVRLSLVNLYLHGFVSPRIHEYDTLTSQDKWNEYADVILANPPFMSPKGGIKPHNRFSVRSSRSEVLFVDYMAEHLAPNGRAGIIVPEGIVYQSQATYARLRKMLLEDALVAVVSLPQGVFNPYSGVKTSILILDKQRAKRTDRVLFARIDDDGRDLGATRKRTGDGDLPATAVVLKDWFRAVDRGESPVACGNINVGALLVTRQDIAKSGDYRLTADTYREVESHIRGGSAWIPLRDVLIRRPVARVGDDQALPVLSITMKQGLVDQSDKFKKRIASSDISGYKRVLLNELVVGFPIDEGVLGIQTLYPAAAVSPAYDVWGIRQDGLDLAFFELILRSQQARSRYRLKMRVTAGRRRTLEKGEFLSMEFPVPPLSEQKVLVGEIADYQKVIDGARTVADGYRPCIPIHPDWPRLHLGDVASMRTGTTPDTDRKDYYVGDVNFVKTGEITNCIIDRTATHVSRQAVKDYNLFLFPAGTILMAMYGQGRTRGQVAYLGVPACTTQNAAAITPKAGLDPQFLFYYLRGQYGALRKHSIDCDVAHLNLSYLRRFEVAIPPLAAQRAIVADIEAEQALVAANRELIARMEKKIQSTLARVWGEEEPVTEVK